MAGWSGRLTACGVTAKAETVECMLLTSAFLTIAARDEAATKADHLDPELSGVLDRLAKDLASFLQNRVGAVPVEIVSDAIVADLCALLDRFASTNSECREGVVAFTAASCLDAQLGRTYVDAFRSRSKQRVLPGGPIPCAELPSARLSSNDRRAMLEAFKPRTGDPKRRADSVIRTTHLRLAAAELEHRHVHYVWADPWLDAISSTARIAAAVTNHSALTQDFRWSEYPVQTREMFYGVEPIDLDAQRDRISTVLDGARASRVTILVLPELSLTHALFDELVARRAFDEIPLVVAGSYHRDPDRGLRANVSTVFANGTAVFTHHKFSDFYFGERHEHLERVEGAAFDLLISPYGTAVVLICKDAIGEVRHLLPKLGPSLVLIPAMSDDTEDFALLAKDLAHDPQCLTIVSCAGPKIQAVLGRPSLNNTVISVSLKDVGCTIFTLDGRSVNDS